MNPWIANIDENLIEVCPRIWSYNSQWQDSETRYDFTGWRPSCAYPLTPSLAQFKKILPGTYSTDMNLLWHLDRLEFFNMTLNVNS